MGCPIPQCGRFKSFRVSRGPIPELRLCQQQIRCLSRYGCVLLCVSRQCAELHALRTPQKKNSLVDIPIYHLHFNVYFLKEPLALHWSQAPRHSVTLYAPACAPHVIVYFRSLLGSLLDFRSVHFLIFLCPVAATTLALLSELLLSELDSDDGCHAIAQIVALDDGSYPRRQCKRTCHRLNTSPPSRAHMSR